MARVHTRKRGRAGSRKPTSKKSPAWVTATKDDALKLVEKLAKEGRSEADIGRLLRDEHGIPSVNLLTGKTVLQILQEKNLAGQYPTDLLDLIKKAVALRKHLKLHTRDLINKRALSNTEAKIRRLVAYYRGKRLPAQWKYDPDTAALLVK